MKMIKIGLLAAALTVAAGLGAAAVPVAHGQRSTAPRVRVAPRALEVFGGRGSEIGVSIREVEDSDVKGGKGAQGVLVEEVTAEGPAAAEIGRAHV